MDSLITLIFFLIVAIVSALLKKKQQSEEQEDDAWSGDSSPAGPPDRRVAPSPRRQTWEDELRRLLEGKTGREPSPPPPPPLPPPTPVRVPEPTAPPAWSRELATRKAETTELARKLRDQKEAMSSRLQESMEHLRHASQLDDRAAMTIRRAASRIHLHAPKEEAQATPGEITSALGWLKSPESLRSAMVASIILGPPKSKEFETGQMG